MFPHFRFGLYIRGRNITEMTPCFPLCVLQGGTVLVCPVTGDVNFEHLGTVLSPLCFSTVKLIVFLS